MTTDERGPVSIESAMVVIPCAEPLSASIDQFTSLGFSVRTIIPADHPRRAVLTGHGLTLSLEVDDAAASTSSVTLRLISDIGQPVELIGPNGAVVEIVPTPDRYAVPPLREEFVLSRLEGDTTTGEGFGEGRAGMGYRDLIPGRLGGRFIASHILIPHGGPVPDYVHFHHVRFQMIYCYRGWVKVLYEDQGDIITMHEGDCVLQPPTIRHRVLEASDAMQVIEIGCPAEHETCGDPETTLPTGATLPDRGYGPDGHRFVFHVAADAEWHPWRVPGFECRDTGIGVATDGLAGVRVARVSAPTEVPVGLVRHSGEFMFVMVLDGSITLHRGADEIRLDAGDSVTLPSGEAFGWSAPSDDAQLLEVTLPATMPFAGAGAIA